MNLSQVKWMNHELTKAQVMLGLYAWEIILSKNK